MKDSIYLEAESKGLKSSYVMHFTVILFVLYGIAEFIKKQISVHM